MLNNEVVRLLFRFLLSALALVIVILVGRAIQALDQKWLSDLTIGVIGGMIYSDLWNHLKRRRSVILFYNLVDAQDSGERRHPAQVLTELGISWETWEGQPIADQIKLYGCKGVPEELPSFLQKG